MIITFIRHLAIIFWGLFIFTKAINQKPTAKSIALQCTFSIALAFLIALTVRVFLPEVVVIAVFSLSCVFNKLIAKTKWDIAITASVLACGISYVLNSLSIIVISALSIFFIAENDVNNSVLVISTICSFFVMGLLAILLFRIRRLKNGFPFLHEKHISLLGVLIALIVFQSYTVIDVINASEGAFNTLMLFLLMSIAVCAVLIYIWWKQGITRTFKDSLVDRERDELNRELAEKDARIEEIERDNSALSRIVHNDRKRIAALENAARRLAMETSEELTYSAKDLLAEVQRVDSERQKELNSYKRDSKPLPITRILSLDTLLNHMKQKAYESNIEFDVFVSGSIKAMIEKHITEEQLRTMTADLLENAIIATKSCDIRQILFTIGIVDECYVVQVEDSGVAFEAATLQELGKKKTTTHADEGGSGIGMMEVFEIMRDTGASLHIEKLDDGRGFTKRVSVRFDGECEFAY